jgi:hypothetical protein
MVVGNHSCYHLVAAFGVGPLEDFGGWSNRRLGRGGEI